MRKPNNTTALIPDEDIIVARPFIFNHGPQVIGATVAPKVTAVDQFKTGKEWYGLL